MIFKISPFFINNLNMEKGRIQNMVHTFKFFILIISIESFILYFNYPNQTNNSYVFPFTIRLKIT